MAKEAKIQQDTAKQRAKKEAKKQSKIDRKKKKEAAKVYLAARRSS